VSANLAGALVDARARRYAAERAVRANSRSKRAIADLAAARAEVDRLSAEIDRLANAGCWYDDSDPVWPRAR
jgi:hypothetical protein